MKTFTRIAAVITTALVSFFVATPALASEGGEKFGIVGKEAMFAGPYQRVVLPGLGHFPQRQGADAVLAQLLPFLQR